VKRALVLLSLCWPAIVVAADTHVYGDFTTTNAGVYWNLGSHWCGLEVRGHPGFFCDVG
jgi:hypothetical protein